MNVKFFKMYQNQRISDSMEINFDVKDIFRMSSVKKSVRFFTSDGIYKKYT